MKNITYTPLYKQIKLSILDRIYSGEWGPGSFLPSEMALAKEYGVSQGTLRKALNDLTAEKHVVRYQGKGTAVAVLDADSTLFPFFMLYDNAGKRVYPLSRTDHVDIGTAGAEYASELGVSEYARVIRIQRVRVLDNNPVINERIVLSADRFPDFNTNIEQIPNTLYEYYQQKYGIHIVRAAEVLGACPADEADMRALHVAAGEPLLEVRRKSYDVKDNVVEFRHSRIVTRNHHYHIKLQ